MVHHASETDTADREKSFDLYFREIAPAGGREGSVLAVRLFAREIGGRK
jgi:hypothetical protein